MSENTIIYSLSRGTDPQVVGDLENLTTSNKSNIVSAVNEVNAKFPVSIENGGTGGTTIAGAVSNLKLSDTTDQDFTANDSSAYFSAVQNYFETNQEPNVPFVFNAGWQGQGYGVAVGAQTTAEIHGSNKTLAVFNQKTGFSIFHKDENNAWENYSPSGILLYSNDSGTAGTVTMSQSSTLFKRIDIYYRNNNSYHYCRTVYNPHNKTTTLESSWLRKSTMILSLKTAQVKIANEYITFDSNNKGTTEINVSNSAISAYDVGTNDTMFICYVIGYR